MPALPEEPSETNEHGYQYTLRVDFDNRDYLAHVEARQRRIAGLDCLAPVPSGTLFQLFPFVVVFDSELTIVAVGDTLRKTYPEKALVGKRLSEVARLRRPRAILSWNMVRFFYEAALR